MTERDRLDLGLLDEDEPFEIDDRNRPHLVKHSPYTPDDLSDAWRDPDGLFVAATAEGPADWLLIARLSGGNLVQIPLAPSNRADGRTCRPIGIYTANAGQKRLYGEERQ